MAKDDIIDVEKVEEEVNVDINEDAAEDVVEEEADDVKKATEKVKDDLKDTADHLKSEAKQSKEKAKDEFKESAERLKEDTRRNAERMKEDAKRSRERFDESYDRTKDVAGKVGENLNKTFDDAIEAMKAFQKTVDTRYQEYRETSIINKIVFDLVEDDENYYVQFYLPGVAKEDIDVEASKNSITIKADFKNVFDKIEYDEEAKPKIVSIGVKSGLAEKTVRFASAIDMEAVSAKQNNGVLFLTAPKLDVPKSKVDIE